MTVRVETRFDGTWGRLVIDRPKANVVSLAVIEDLRAGLAGVCGAHTRLVTIEGAGDHFSYGAAVEEHVPATIARVLAALDDLVRDLLAAPAPTAALVKGRCLGGGFEIALACDFVFAADTALLGVPEVALGVFPPLASVLLPVRIGASRAAAAVITGEVRPVPFWQQAGLITLTAPAADLQEAADGFFRQHLQPRSATALAAAARASRLAIRRQLETALPELERQYLDELMHTRDAREGIAAFLDKRAPEWRDA
ncbi:MAG: enoyl-CoA hydratase/isomerase family protein [Betaproteobacteria bacterium]